MMVIRQTQTILDEIVARKQERLYERRKVQPVSELQAIYEAAGSAGELPLNARFSDNLKQPKTLSLIAEIKKASPSKGLIQPDFNPAEQAAAYAAAGVQAISVLTEEDYFLGSDEHLKAVHATVTVPILRKDFTVEPGQIYEARLLGASAVLLICAVLEDKELAGYLQLTHQLGMQALVEIHSLPELMRALSAGAQVIGINNRDLHSFHVDLNTTERLAGLIPNDRVIVAESGITTANDLARVYRAGAHAALIGETLMRSAGSPESVRAKIHELFGAMPK